MIRLGAVGDVVRTLPAASRIRAAYPGAHLAWLVEPGSADLLRAQSWIDEVIEVPRPDWVRLLRSGRLLACARAFAGFVSALREHRFDLVVDFHSILRSGVLSALSGAPTRVAFARPFGREAAYWFATDTASLTRRRSSRFDRCAALVEFLAIDALPIAHPLEVDPALRARLGAELSATAADPVVALHPGSSDSTPYKRYPVAAFAALARQMFAENGLRSVVTWGPGRDDRALAQQVVHASLGCATLAPETGSLPELAALLDRCRLLVSGDSGPLHVASLVGTPVVQILGPTHPLENAPYAQTDSRALRHALSCSPCRRGCAAATCMRMVPPGEVASAVADLLETPSLAIGGDR